MLLRAWSIRLLLLVEVALPHLGGYLPLPPRLFAGLSGPTVVAAFVARTVAQGDFEDAE
ncbi:hypothetical protein HJA97_04420 [Rhizobium binae]|uniref:DUF7940 domain-containing protein n=1 Tax=Rhizobium binae TaxID=1138190 RepID=UPI001C82F6FD|nr:hypothetical protein [Rhizobium binae]MBX4936798.1 hypothetical protein [Rhizobium binae]MBX4943123.1 hypothetical protein [Rhizobium binae]MBX4978729.1 hypothetical protein [Rhizobium binae]